MAYTAYKSLTLDEMLEKVKKYDDSPASLDLIRRAGLFAQQAHQGQYRKSGEEYIIHPMYVASILVELTIDPPTIAAALLHDTVEDCENVTLPVLQEQFGEEVARLVDGVTKLDKLDFADREEQQAESLRKMILAMSKDIRVVLIKLADRLHNMRTLNYQPADRQVSIARETLDIYAPLAHRLGMQRIKQELEDRGLYYLDPIGYAEVRDDIEKKYGQNRNLIETLRKHIEAKLRENEIKYVLGGRVKSVYSIYKKMYNQNKSF
ncbi:MAG: bifunctional (p)ppGpp synthetase/guanosine-3',5'-bis(diphosphate) 3'-pyrophosphohydrolase, partial [Clostridiales bacterium]|nr:bifunctional (p)ppGpp synthetase/guanosine-3',5'-bis(diphosphate) 3'-pyrophosphohydrolase [Clostridiales bacterium]